ncbi:hypothetical protein OQA88_6394 [Cercophora sp. LCS_1]
MAPLPPHQNTPRIITYYQTHHDSSSGAYISVLPLLSKPAIGLTHLILAALHINEDPTALTLNDHHPSHPRFTTLWAELRILQASGIKVLGMLGGAAKGTFTRLDQDEQVFERYYVPLRDMVLERGLDGLDLDVEEKMSLAGIIRLIDRLRADFGREFIITLAPVAAALLNAEHNLSGFDYEALEVMRGREIGWYNAQFYCGWGDCSNPLMYEMLMRKGWSAEKIVVGLVTNPENGSGWVPWEALAGVLPVLVGRHPAFGGVMGWEYFNSLPGGKESPWQWCQWMTALLKGRRAVDDDAARDLAAATNMTKPSSSSEKRTDEVDPDEDAKGGVTLAPVPKDFEYHSDGAGDE